MIEAYPLRWPKGRPRTPPQARQAAKFRTGFALAVRRVQHEARALGGHDPVVSTDLPLRPDGLPVAGTRGREPADPGAAAYFDWEGLRHCVACDRWQRVEDNVHAIALGPRDVGPYGVARRQAHAAPGAQGLRGRGPERRGCGELVARSRRTVRCAAACCRVGLSQACDLRASPARRLGRRHDAPPHRHPRGSPAAAASATTAEGRGRSQTHHPRPVVVAPRRFRMKTQA